MEPVLYDEVLACEFPWTYGPKSPIVMDGRLHYSKNLDNAGVLGVFLTLWLFSDLL